MGFYGMEAPLALAGHYIQNSLQMENRWFCFEHYFIGWTLEDEVLLHMTEAIGEKRWLEIKTFANQQGVVSHYRALPFFIMVSVQNGRRYLAAYHRERKQYTALRLDYIDTAKAAELCPQEEYEQRRQTALAIRDHIWGASWQAERELCALRFQIECEPRQQEERFQSMKAEARGGSVKKVGQNRVEFSIEVYDVMEMMPWVRTFLGQICEIACSEESFVKRFFDDLEAMRLCYGADAQAETGSEEKKDTVQKHRREGGADGNFS